MRLFIVLLTLIEIKLSSQQQQQEPRINFIVLGNFTCKGNYAGDYTVIVTIISDSCDPSSLQINGPGHLILSSGNGQKTINNLILLAASLYPAGAYYQVEALYLVTSGNLVGKYLYLKEIILKEAYLKKCSSVLGLSYVWTKSQVILIAEQIKLKIFLNPGGGFEPFKNISTSICQGQSYIV